MSGITRRFCKRCLWAKPTGPRPLCVTSPQRRNGVKPPQLIHTGVKNGTFIGPGKVIYRGFRSDCGKDMVTYRSDAPSIATFHRPKRGQKFVKKSGR